MNNKGFLLIIVVLFLYSCKTDEPKRLKYVCGYSYEWKGFDTENEMGFSSDSAFAFFASVSLYDQDLKKIWEPDKGLWNPFVLNTEGNFKKTSCILQAMNVSDSIHLYIPKNDFTSEWMKNLNSNSDSTVILAIKLLGKLTKAEWKKFCDSLRKLESKKLDSIWVFRKYFKDSSGILFHKKLPEEIDSKSRNGTFEITYGCRSLSGMLLDSTFDPVYIQDEDLGRSYFLKSINYVIKRISCNDTIKFILPSHMAFGEKGFYSIIPPNTPLEYTLIKRKK
jgi:hypothetical protein